MKVFLIWERECYDEYDVICVTFDEHKAKEISGENSPWTWKDKKNDDTERWYEEREIDKVNNLFDNSQ